MEWEAAESIAKDQNGNKVGLINGEWHPITSQAKNDAGNSVVIRSASKALDNNNFENKFDAAQAATSNQQQNVEDNPISNNYEGTVLHSFARTPAKIARGVNQFGYNLLPEHMQKEADKFYNTNIADNFDSVDRLAEGGLNEDVRQTEAKFQKQRAAQGREGFDAGAFVGDLLFTAPALMAKPFQIAKGAKDIWNATNMAKAAGQGAVIEGVQPVTKEGNYWDNKISDTASVAGASALGGPLSAGLARILSPKLSTAGNNSPVNRLMKQNINPSLGQILGGQSKRFEDAASYFPGIGNLINSAERKAQKDLNRAVYDLALKGTGKTAKDMPVGAEGFTKLGKIFEQQYKDALEGTSFKVDDNLISKLSSLSPKVNKLRKDHQDDFNGVLDDVIDLIGNKSKTDKSKLDELLKSGKSLKTNDPEIRALIQAEMRGANKSSKNTSISIEDKLAKLEIGNNLSGREFKDIQSYLSKELRGFGGNEDRFAQREADVIRSLKKTLEDHFEHLNPTKAPKLKQVNKNYNNYAVIRDAATQKAAQTETGFTVGQFGSAVKKADTSIGKAAFGEGRNDIQKLYHDALNVLGERSLETNTLRTSGVGGAAGAATAGAVGVGSAASGSVLIPAALLASIIPYLSPKLTGKAFAKRPDFAPKLADSLRKYGPRGAAAISANE